MTRHILLLLLTGALALVVRTSRAATVVLPVEVTSTLPAGTIPNDQKAFDMSATCDVLGVGYGGRNFASAFDVTDGVGEELWRDYTAGNVQTVAIMGDDLVIGGHFSQVNHERRIRIASVDLTTGTLTSWNPDVDGQFYGPWDLLVTGDQLYIGGFFTSVAGLPHYFFARFTDA